MEQDRDRIGKLTPLARLIGQMPDGSAPGAPGAAGSLWQRLDMEGIARRLIQTARIAAGEHMLKRAEDAIRRRDQDAAGRGGTPVPGPDGKTATA